MREKTRKGSFEKDAAGWRGYIFVVCIRILNHVKTGKAPLLIKVSHPPGSYSSLPTDCET